MGSAPAFSVTPLEFCSRFHSHRILHRPFGICQSRFLPGRHLPQNSAETQVSRFAGVYWSRDLLGMLRCFLLCRILERQSGDLHHPTEFLNRTMQKKIGSPLQESFQSPDINSSAPDFSFSRAQRLWDVICAIWDHAKALYDRILRAGRNLAQRERAKICCCV